MRTVLPSIVQQASPLGRGGQSGALVREAWEAVRVLGREISEYGDSCGLQDCNFPKFDFWRSENIIPVILCSLDWKKSDPAPDCCQGQR